MLWWYRMQDVCVWFFRSTSSDKISFNMWGLEAFPGVQEDEIKQDQITQFSHATLHPPESQSCRPANRDAELIKQQQLRQQKHMHTQTHISAQRGGGQVGCWVGPAWLSDSEITLLTEEWYQVSLLQTEAISTTLKWLCTVTNYTTQRKQTFAKQKFLGTKVGRALTPFRLRWIPGQLYF